MKSVTIQGTKYAVGYVLAAYIEKDDDLPVFGVILIKQKLSWNIVIKYLSLGMEVWNKGI